MVRQEKKFRKEYSHQLLAIAKGDFESAKVLAKAGSGRAENVCFLVHQVIEKSLKAVLCFLEILVPLVHDLGVLIAKMPETLDLPFGYELNELNDYAAVRRYEEGEVEITSDDLDEVVKRAEEVLQWASKVCKK